MNGIDIVILGVFLISTLIGAMRGFTKELLSLFSWGGSLFFSSLFLPVVQGFMHQYIANPVMAGGAGFFCTFIVSLVVLSIIANIIAGYIHESSFRGIDHSLGFGFGILRGVVFISAAELILSTFWPRQSQPPTIQTARFVPMARKGGDTVLQILPSSARTWILEQAAKVENQAYSKLRDNLKGAAPNILEGIHGGLPSSALDQYPGQQEQSSAKIILPGHPQQGLPQVMVPPHQGAQVPPQMLVIRPPQPGQVPQLAPVNNSPEMPYSPQPAGLAQSAAPRDKQSTVDALSRLTPQSSPHKEDSGYTQGQRDDMDRLFRAADGG